MIGVYRLLKFDPAPNVPSASFPSAVRCIVSICVALLAIWSGWQVTCEFFPSGWVLGDLHNGGLRFGLGVNPEAVGLLLATTLLCNVYAGVTRNVEALGGFMILAVAAWVVVGVFHYAGADFPDRTATALNCLYTPLPAFGAGLASYAVMSKLGKWCDDWQVRANHALDLTSGEVSNRSKSW